MPTRARRHDVLVLALSLVVVALVSWPTGSAVHVPILDDVARPLLPQPPR